MDLLVAGGDVLTMDAERRIILDGAVAISGGTIVEVGTAAELVARFPDAERLDASGCVVTPWHRDVFAVGLSQSFNSAHVTTPFPAQ